MLRHEYARRALIAASLGLCLTLAGASGPALAGTTPPNYGSTVMCRYHTNSPGPAFTAKIRKIIVTPPEMFAKSGQQTVGWRYVVQRTIDEGAYPSHQVTYKSPIDKASATTAKAANFETMSVGVALPSVDNLRDVTYQVELKMMWYRANGSVQSTASYLMPTYSVHVKGDGWHYSEDDHDTCEAVQWAAV